MSRVKQFVRWTQTQAAVEFNLATKTLSQRLIQKGIQPGADKCFSTLDICRAVFSDLDFETTELRREQKELIALKKMKLAETLVFRDDVQKLWDEAVIGLRQKIADSDIPEQKKHEILKDLQTIEANEYTSKNKTASEDDADDELEEA
jgi:hypothetical protein